jgi:hypothetical protein
MNLFSLAYSLKVDSKLKISVRTNDSKELGTILLTKNLGGNSQTRKRRGWFGPGFNGSFFLGNWSTVFLLIAGSLSIGRDQRGAPQVLNFIFLIFNNF